MSLKVIQLIKHATKYGVHDIAKGKEIPLSSQVVNHNRPFVFSAKENSTSKCNYDETEIRALPFNICSIELEGEAAVLLPESGMGDIWFLSCICNEVSPGNYEFYMLASLDGITPDGVMLVTNGAMYGALLSLINNYIDKLSVGIVGKCTYEKSIILKTNGQSRVVKFKDYTYINNAAFENISNMNGHTVNYSHSFEVRGHWRKVKGLGCDREGNRSIDGATWISSYNKGDINDPLIIKTRIAGI